MMPTANEALFDAMVRHQIYLMRYSASLRKRITELLNASEADIAATIRERLRTYKGSLSAPADVKRLEVLLGIVKNTRLKAWAQVDAEWLKELTALAQTEPVTLQGIIATTSPVVTQTILPPPRLLKAIVTSKPFEGRVLKEWSKTLRAEDLRRIDNAVRMGMMAGEDSATIARRVVGTARLKGTDGITQITRRQAAAVTRTAVNHVGAQARAEFVRENDDLVTVELFVSTLDSRTTPVCRANDGKEYPVNVGPIPPLHFGCRSLRVPQFGDDLGGKRPAKPMTEKMLLREYHKEHGIKGAGLTRDGLPKGHKGAFDKFSRKRVRELTGRVSNRTSYQEWLATQSREFQDDILGRSKGKLFREGGLRLDQFVDRNGTELNLGQLASKHASAFKAAGLDPAAFTV